MARKKKDPPSTIPTPDKQTTEAAPAQAPTEPVDRKHGVALNPPAYVEELKQLLLNQQQMISQMASHMALQDQELKSVKGMLGAEQHEFSANPEIQENKCYVRVKPCDRRNGYPRMNQSILAPDLGIINVRFQGGTGRPGDIPTWYPFPAKDYDRLRVGLARYRQKPGDRNSRPVFDVATAKERMQIDQAEESMRLAVIGVGSPQRAAAAARDGVRARTRGGSAAEMTPEPEPLTLAPGAQAYVKPVAGGRAAALEGLEEIPPQPQEGPPSRRAKRVHTVGEKNPQAQDLTASFEDRLESQPGLAEAVSFAREHPLDKQS